RSIKSPCIAAEQIMLMKSKRILGSGLGLLGMALFGQSVTDAELNLGVEPVPMHVNPGHEYSDEARDYAMSKALERTRKGRLWAAWIAGGDSDKAFIVAATSDDRGETWSAPRFVIDPADAPSGL